MDVLDISIICSFSLYEKDETADEIKYKRVSINRIHKCPELKDFSVKIDDEILNFDFGSFGCSYEEDTGRYEFVGCNLTVDEGSLGPDVLTAKYLSRAKRIKSVKALFEYKNELYDAAAPGKYIIKFADIVFVNEKTKVQYDICWDAIRKFNEMQYKK